MQRETVAVDTPTAAATARIVALPGRPWSAFGLSSFIMNCKDKGTCNMNRSVVFATAAIACCAAAQAEDKRVDFSDTP
jgi:hypothetical protein